MTDAAGDKKPGVTGLVTSSMRLAWETDTGRGWAPEAALRGQEGPGRPWLPTQPWPGPRGELERRLGAVVGNGQTPHGKAGLYRKATSYRKGQ